MELEDFPLNKGHREHRRAVDYEKRGEFENAIASHKKTITFLVEAIMQSSNKSVQDSLNIQVKYHLNQVHRLATRNRGNQSNTKKCTNCTSINNSIISPDTSVSTNSSNRTIVYDDLNSVRLKLSRLLEKVEALLDDSEFKKKKEPKKEVPIEEIIDRFMAREKENPKINKEVNGQESYLENPKDTENVQFNGKESNTSKSKESDKVNGEEIVIETDKQSERQFDEIKDRKNEKENEESKDESETESEKARKFEELLRKNDARRIEVSNLIAEIKLCHNNHFDYMKKLLNESHSCETENVSLQSEVKNLRSKISDLEKEKSKLGASAGSESPVSLEFPPLELPPMFID